MRAGSFDAESFHNEGVFELDGAKMNGSYFSRGGSVAEWSYDFTVVPAVPGQTTAF